MRITFNYGMTDKTLIYTKYIHIGIEIDMPMFRLQTVVILNSG